MPLLTVCHDLNIQMMLISCLAGNGSLMSLYAHIGPGRALLLSLVLSLSPLLSRSPRCIYLCAWVQPDGT